nr:hypothetical protein TetV2_00162 [Oceanusvirus sp.]
MNRFLLKRVVFVLWFVRLVKESIRIALDAPCNILSFPYRDLPTLVERLDSAEEERSRMCKRVISLRNPVVLLFGIWRPPSSRRKWLEANICALARSARYVYVLHYWDGRGNESVLLTGHPKRGLYPLPKPTRGPCRSKVLSASHLGTDVTGIIAPVSATFHPSEAPVSTRNLFTYLRYKSKRTWKEVVSHPILVMDSRLEETAYVYPPSEPWRSSW